MRYFLESGDGGTLELEVQDLGEGRYRVLCAGRELAAEFSDVDRMGQYALRLGPRSYALSIEPAEGGELRVHIAGEAFQWKILDERERAASAVRRPEAGGDETVRAPMPGVVVGVRVQPGETVAAGAPVAVVEAMKMQNEIAAAQGGLVQEVLARPGQTVARNQPLVVLRRLP